MKESLNSQRIDVADVLRGFAIMGIFLIHSIEHFNFYSFPQVDSTWMKFTDKIIWDSLFFAFSGKTYSIFAILFGFSFFIQDNNQLQRGYDFRLRFMWRMLLLFLWGNINAMFFTGEILVMYAILSIPLVLISRLKTKTILIIATIMMLQPIELGKIIYALLNPDFVPGEPLTNYYWGKAWKVQSEGTFLETVKMNLWYGQMANMTWAWENARILQTPALFMIGFVIGRLKLFTNTENNIRFWRRALIIGIITFFPLTGLANILPGFIENKAVLNPIILILKSLSNMSLMTFTISLIIQLYYLTNKGCKLLDKLRPYGKMTLTCYITQSMIGSFIFYNWGLGLHNKLTITHSFLLGIVLFLLQYAFSCWWMKHHSHGPLEYVWRKLTWIGKKK